jgi:hypothetical protein
MNDKYKKCIEEEECIVSIKNGPTLGIATLID